MAEVINLNRARKAKMRAAAVATAEANRASHGRTKAERQAAEIEATRLGRSLDGHRRDPDDDDAG